MKKIGVCIAGNLKNGGAYNYVVSILEAVMALPKEQYDAEIISYGFEIDAKYIEKGLKYKIVDVRLMDRVLRKVYFMLHLPISLWRKISPILHPLCKALKKGNYDLLVFPAQDSFCFEADIPYVASIYDLMHRYEKRFPDVTENGQYEKREFLYTHMCEYAKGILVDSVVGKHQAVESYGIADQKVYDLPFRAPNYVFEPNNVDAETVRNKYQLPKKYIFYPASFWWHKNHLNLVKAIHAVKQRFPDIQLILTGAGCQTSYPAVFEWVEKHDLKDQVRYIGFVPDDAMYHIYKMARMMIMPTFFGPTNIPQLEAFAIGCPVGTSRIYGIPDQVKDAALLFDPSSVNEMAEVIAKVWADDALYQDLINKGKQRAREWGILQFNQKFAEIISAVLDTNDQKPVQ